MNLALFSDSRFPDGPNEANAAERALIDDIPRRRSLMPVFGLRSWLFEGLSCLMHRSVRSGPRPLFAAALVMFAADAVALDIGGPAHSVHFGTSVTVLPNGNIVVTDPDADSSIHSGVGAVYLYGPTGTPISTITGSQPDDHVGSAGITVLTNGNYVIMSPQWRNASAVNAGAVTFASATSGVSGVVSTANSLVGSSAGDAVGTASPLGNGNYVVSSFHWTNAGAADAGAVTWCAGNGSTLGAVSAANSLVGASAGDQVGIYRLTVLSNGNYVVDSPFWGDGNVADLGAATWANGGGGTVGTVSAANSLIGSTSGDEVGSSGVAALSNGNYVVVSGSWSNGATLYVGAATWGNGNGGTVGPVSPSNSLTGDEGNDEFGGTGIIPLPNGDYVVSSARWHSFTGAATWVDGSAATSGVVSATNSLIGGSAGDRISGGGLAVLANGDYVVASPNWNGAFGAVTWANGNGGTTGPVSGSNSLVGTSTNDDVGGQPTVPLANGDYVVWSPDWNGSLGAVTWGNGNGGTVAAVSSANSLVGSSAGDQVGLVLALANGNYVAASPTWDDGGNTDVGAATWASAGGDTVGPVSSGNSLIGTSAGDGVGAAVYALSNGNYVVASTYWGNGGAAGVGAVTLGNGRYGTIGIVSTDNSLVGSSAGDNVGSAEVDALANSSYVVLSPEFNSGGLTEAGAITLRRGNDFSGDAISAQNSVIGGVAGQGSSMVYAYDSGRDQLVVGRPAENIVTLFKADRLYRDGFD